MSVVKKKYNVHEKFSVPDHSWCGLGHFSACHVGRGLLQMTGSQLCWLLRCDVLNVWTQSVAVLTYAVCYFLSSTANLRLNFRSCFLLLCTRVTLCNVFQSMIMRITLEIVNNHVQYRMTETACKPKDLTRKAYFSVRYVLCLCPSCGGYSVVRPSVNKVYGRNISLYLVNEFQ